MLQELNIKNIALIRELSISFEKGLNVLSGETGAGKTIIVDSVSLVLGDRGFRELIRHGEEKGSVEALFMPEDPEALRDVFEEYGLEPGELVVSRELTAAGKNVCRVNGRLMPLSSLKSLMLRMVNLHSQGQHADIFEKKRQLELLDRYAGNGELLEAAAQAFKEYSSVKKELEGLETDEKERARMADMLAFQIKEITAAKLRPGEEDELLQEKLVIKNAERISDGIHSSHELLCGESGALSRLKGTAHALSGISEFSEKYSKLEAAVNDAYYALEDAGYELSGCLDDAVYDEKRIDEIESRLELIFSLKRKYGADVSEVLAFAENAKVQLNGIEHSDERRQELTALLGEKNGALSTAAKTLSLARKGASERLSEELVAHLVDLGMKDARFSVRFEEKQPDRSGADEAEFYITLNRGEPEKPLAKVASGGEASRIMLAVKNIFASRDDVGTLIFDEIDTGISGNMARVVAQKLANISRERQVICVSHLPQLAAMGDANFEIVKSNDELGAVTTVNRLQREEKLHEIARLSGGMHTETAIKHAQELLEECERFKSGA